MRRIAVLLLLVAPMLTTGCLTIRIGGNTEPMEMEMDGLVNGFASFDGVRPWDGTIVLFRLLDGGGDPGEITSLGIWPLAEVGVGLVGFRLQLLPLEMGFGTLLYDPQPQSDRYDHDDDDDDRKTDVVIEERETVIRN